MKVRQFKMHLFRWLVFFVLIAVPLLAQNPSGTLRGKITDPSGAVIPQASVTAPAPAGKTANAVTNDQGIYEIKGLAPGNYTVTAVAKGFAVDTEQNVAIAAGQTQQFDFALQIAVQPEKIQVQEEGTTVSVSPSENATSIIIKGKDLEALSDDPDELQSELEALAGPSAGPNGGQIYIDGFTGGQIPPKSSIREIRINQNPFSAQYDTLGYGRIEIFTKPGTDKFHGSFFVNGNDSAFNAIWSPVEVEQPPYHSEIFNGDFSGPLGKNASFFVNAERRDINSVSIVDATVLNSNFLPVALNQAISNPSTRTNVSPRLDFQLGKNNTLSVRYQFTRNSQQNQGIGQFSLFPSQAFNLSDTEHTLQISDTQVINSNVVNETRFQYIRDSNNQSPLITPALTLSVLGGFTSGGNNTGTVLDYANHFELQNYTSIVHHNHLIKFGGRLRATTDANQAQSDFNGMYTFPSLTAYANAVSGIVCAPTSQNPCGPTQFSIARGQAQFQVSLVDAGLYAEDEWKIRPNMTLNYGLRFETQNGISDHADIAPRVSFAWGLGGTKKTQPKTVIRAGSGLFYNRFAYNLVLQSERLNPNGTGQTQFVATNPPYYPTPTASQIASLIASSTTSPTYFQIAPNLRAPYTIQSAVSVERQLSKSATVAVTYLNSLGDHQFFIRNVNAPLPGTYNPLTTSGVRPLSSAYGNDNLFQYDSEGVYRQNELIANFRVNMGTKLSLFGFYTLNYADSDLGTGSPTSVGGGGGGFSSGGATSTPEFVSNPYDPMADYGRASFDTHDRGLLGGTITLPYSFRLSPFMVVNSGSPYNLTVGQDLYGFDTFNERPAFVSSTTCAARVQSGNVVCTPLGTFNNAPALGQVVVPINSGTGPTNFTLNLRLSKTFAFGPETKGAGATGPRGGGGGRGGPGGGGLGGRGLTGGGGSNPFGSPPSNRRYNLTFSVSARNSVNRLNLGPPIADIDSPLAGRYYSLAAGPFSSSGNASRRIDLQMMFSF